LCQLCLPLPAVQRTCRASHTCKVTHVSKHTDETAGRDRFTAVPLQCVALCCLVQRTHCRASHRPQLLSQCPLTRTGTTVRNRKCSTSSRPLTEVQYTVTGRQLSEHQAECRPHVMHTQHNAMLACTCLLPTMSVHIHALCLPVRTLRLSNHQAHSMQMHTPQTLQHCSHIWCTGQRSSRIRAVTWARSLPPCVRLSCRLATRTQHVSSKHSPLVAL
jgi:hypothetical protein